MGGRSTSETRGANKLIFVVSDGAPVDDSTLQANGADYLDRHLRQVINRIELSGEFVLAGIGLDYDVFSILRATRHSTYK